MPQSAEPQNAVGRWYNDCGLTSDSLAHYSMTHELPRIATRPQSRPQRDTARAFGPKPVQPEAVP
jgi:hypothetical protein